MAFGFTNNEKSSLIEHPKAPEPTRLENGSYWLNLVSGIVLLGTFILFCSESLTKMAVVDTAALGLVPYTAVDLLNWIVKMAVNSQHFSQTNSASDVENQKEKNVASSFLRRAGTFAYSTIRDSNILLPIFACINSMVHGELQESNGYFFTASFTLGFIGLCITIGQNKCKNLFSSITSLMLLAAITTGVGLAFIEDSPLQGNLNVIRAVTASFGLLTMLAFADAPKKLMDSFKPNESSGPSIQNNR